MLRSLEERRICLRKRIEAVQKGLNLDPILVVVVYQCSICNVLYTWDIEAFFVLVHAVLDC